MPPRLPLQKTGPRTEHLPWWRESWPAKRVGISPSAYPFSKRLSQWTPGMQLYHSFLEGDESSPWFLLIISVSCVELLLILYTVIIQIMVVLAYFYSSK